MQKVQIQPELPHLISNKGKILVFCLSDKIPENLILAIKQLKLHLSQCTFTHACDILAQISLFDLVVLVLDKSESLQNALVGQVTEQLQKFSLRALVFTVEDAREGLDGSHSPYLLLVSGKESGDMIMGRLAMLLELRNTMQDMREEIDRLEMIQQPLNEYFSQVDEEMRLAARLQRDFLPQNMPAVNGIHFATVFRPASWVSGDVYDIMRLDEDHLGFYVADAVGHGVPAALLTMFIKRALVTKRIEGNKYLLIEPGEALTQLNSDMVGQELSNFQFATCCYCLLNTRTLEIRYASGGHPSPILIDNQGRTRELTGAGPLLGVFADQVFETKTAQLTQGDKLLLYSDGVELAFVNDGPDKPLRFRQEFGNLADDDIQTMCDKLMHIIDREEGSLHPKDDVTIVGLHVRAPG